MTLARRLQWSFSGGEQSPEMAGHVEDPGFQTGLETMRNMIATVRGPARRRPGFERVAQCHGDVDNVGARMLTFKYSDTQALAVEMGRHSATVGYIRFHSEGSPIEFTPNTPGADPMTWDIKAFWGLRGLRIFEASDTEPFGCTIISEEFTTVDGDLTVGTDTWLVLSHGFATGDPVGLLATGNPASYPTTAGGPLSSSNVYYIIELNDDEYQIAASHQDALDRKEIVITGDTGGETLHWGVADMLVDGEGVRFDEGGGTLPAPLLENTTYYVYNNGAAIGWTLYYSEAEALAGTTNGLVNLEASLAFPGSAYGDGLSKWYTAGDLVEHDRTTGTYYTATIDHDGLAFVADNWLEQESTNIYTIAAPYHQLDLFEVNYTQSLDVMTLTHQDYPVRELQRFGLTTWRLVTTSFEPSIRAPTAVTVTPTAGRVLLLHPGATGPPLVNTVAVGGPPPVINLENVNFGSPTTALAKGDIVYINGTTVAAVTALQARGIAPGEYAVEAINSNAPNDFTIQNVDSTNVTATVGDVVGATVEVVPLSSERTNSYKVTSVDEIGRESLPTAAVEATNNLFVEGAYNTITWEAVADASEYRIYKEKSGLYGYIGTVDSVETLSFKDEVVAPNLGQTPPYDDTTLDGTEYPASTSYFQQRRIFAATSDAPQGIWMTESGTESSLQYHLPVQASDRIRFSVKSREAEQIRHIIGMDHLLIFTDQSEYRVTPVNTDALTPSSIDVRPQSYVGSSYARPLIVGRSILFNEQRGGRIYETQYRAEAEGFVPVDRSVRSEHLFEDRTIKDSALMRSPDPIAWWTSSNGDLLGMTFSTEHQIGAWHRHDTGDSTATFESCCVVPEGGEDRLYVVVNRNGTRSVERMSSMTPASIETGFYVDDGYTETIVAAYSLGNTFPSGTEIAHLDGETVQVLINGTVYPDQVVTNDAITMPVGAEIGEVITVGLAYTSQLKSMPFTAQLDALAQGRQKNINQMWVRVFESGPFEVGTTDALLRNADPYGTMTSLTTDEIDVTLLGEWNASGQFFIQQTNPYPLTVVSATALVSIGGT